MKISAINGYQSYTSFKGSKNSEYENPINRKTEKGLAIWNSIGASVLTGGIAAGIGSCFIPKGAEKRALKLGGIGAAAGLALMALTLPSKLYDTKVKAFVRDKEMDVFSREKDLKSNIMEQVNEEAKNEDVDLDTKINHYTTVQMANKGNGLLVKGA